MNAQPSGPDAVFKARDALTAMSEPQRIAMAIEIINGVRAPQNAYHVLRLGSLAEKVGGELMKASFEQECI
jgi:hypothetical protein